MFRQLLTLLKQAQKRQKLSFRLHNLIQRDINEGLRETCVGMKLRAEVRP